MENFFLSLCYMTTQVPDFVSTNLDPVQFQRDMRNNDGYRTVQQITEERLNLGDAKDNKMVQFNSKDAEDFPYKYVLTGIQELGAFSTAYFSSANLNWLHSNIRYKVFTLSKDNTVISKQRDMDVLESMRRIYLQNSNNPQSKTGMKVEMLRLNNLVLEDIVPRIISEIVQNKNYLKDIEKVRVPNNLPVNTSVVGTKLYERGPADVLGINV